MTEVSKRLTNNSKDSESLLRTSPEKQERLANNNIYLSDVVQHLIATCSIKEIKMPTRSEPWQFLLYDARKVDGAPVSVKDAFFDAETYPRCNHLEECLSNLVLTSTLRTFSPRFRTYSIDATTRDEWLTELEKTPKSYRAFIDTLSEMARKEFELYKT